MSFNGYKPSQNYQLKNSGTSSENERCVIRISMCDDKKFQLHKLSTNELKDFMSYVKQVENMTWSDIKTHSGLRYKVLNNIDYKIPDNVPNDISICSMRVNQKFRVLGYRENIYFFVIWFDNNHKTC